MVKRAFQVVRLRKAAPINVALPKADLIRVDLIKAGPILRMVVNKALIPDSNSPALMGKQVLTELTVLLLDPLRAGPSGTVLG